MGEKIIRFAKIPGFQSAQLFFEHERQNLRFKTSFFKENNAKRGRIIFSHTGKNDFSKRERKVFILSNCKVWVKSTIRLPMSQDILTRNLQVQDSNDANHARNQSNYHRNNLQSTSLFREHTYSEPH